MKDVRIGLIGATGWMGKTHAAVYASAPSIFGNEPARPVLEMVAAATDELASTAAAEYGAKRWTSDWREVVIDPDIDVVDIVTPNKMHKEMVIAALKAGKHVYCEKPLGRTADETREMLAAARDAGVITLVGHNYPHNPIHSVARDIISGGEIGELVNVRMSFNVDFLADKAVPFFWRCDAEEAGGGTVGDINVHVFSFTEYLIGPIAEVCSHLTTVVKEREVVDGATIGRKSSGGARKTRIVDTDDAVQMLALFQNGCTGIFDTSRVAHGHKITINYDIVGRLGSLSWTNDRLNELQHYSANDAPDRGGFKRIETNPSHPYYGAYYPIGNIGMGYNDMKAIEVRELIQAVAGETVEVWPNFEIAHRIQRCVDATILSHQERRWVNIEEIAD